MKLRTPRQREAERLAAIRADGARRLAQREPDCAHWNHEPVVLSDGREVARICTDCLWQLPVTWDCPDCMWTFKTGEFGSVRRGYSGVTACEKHRRWNGRS